MIKLGRRKGMSKSANRRAGLAIAAIALVAAMPACRADDAPTFRSGLWKFERTLETDGKTTNQLLANGLSINQEIIRCMNPTFSVKAEFTSFEACKPRDLQKTDGSYALQRVCGGNSPIKTQIDVKSDSAYTEINEGNIGKMSTKETVVARRVGDCRGG
jgi:hypothetical protein